MLNNFKQDYEVCSCSHVKLGVIIDFIKVNKVKKLGQLQDFLKIGAGCKYCICKEVDLGKIKKEIYCKDILESTF